MNTHARYVNTLTRWIQVTDRKIKTEVYSRVVGYFRPIDQWNKGKKEEFSERKYLDVNKALQMPDKGNAKRINAGQ